MWTSRTLRHIRRLSTTATTATNVDPEAISISKAKFKLRSEHNPEKAVGIYSTVSKHYASPSASRYALHLTVKRLLKSRKFQQIETLIESHKNDPKIKHELFLTTLIRSYGIAGMFDHALQTFNQMDDLGTPRTAISFNGLLQACLNSKLFERVPQLFDEMPKRYGILPDKVSYGMLIKAYCELGSIELGIEMLKEMEEKGVEISVITFTTILNSLYKRGNVEEAERIWDEMVRKGCVPDVGAYNVRLMQAQGGEPVGVKRLIEEMSDAGLKPDTISYNYLITCYCRNNVMDEAMKVFEGLEGNGCQPNATTFRSLVYYLCRNEMFEDGYGVFKKSVVANQIPNFGTLKPLVEGLVKTSNRKDAKALVCTVKEKFPNNLVNAWTKVEEELGLVNDD